MKLRTILSRGLTKTAFPLIPRKFRLPFRYWLGVLEGTLEPELKMLSCLTERRGTAVDIGANFGLYAWRMSRMFKQTYAFEINEELVGDLRAYNPGNVEIETVGLSSRHDDATLYIPVLNGQRLYGWASLLPGNCPDTAEHETKRVKIQTLDAYELTDVSLIKIDVEGHELHVLEGSGQTIARCRPTVLVEVREANLTAVSQFFSDRGYVARRLRDFSASEGSVENLIFCPK